MPSNDFSTPPTVLSRVLDLLPSHVKPIQVLDSMGRTQAMFDPTCAGTIERAWPQVFRLCEECDCEAQLISTDTLETRSVLSTVSGAPDFSTAHRHSVVLVLTPAERLRRAA